MRMLISPKNHIMRGPGVCKRAIAPFFLLLILVQSNYNPIFYGIDLMNHEYYLVCKNKLKKLHTLQIFYFLVQDHNHQIYSLEKQIFINSDIVKLSGTSSRDKSHCMKLDFCQISVASMVAILKDDSTLAIFKNIFILSP